MIYSCLIERTIEVEADSEQDAEKKASLALIAELQKCEDNFVIWESE